MKENKGKELEVELEEWEKLETEVNEGCRKLDIAVNDMLKKLETADNVALMLKMSRPAVYEAVRRGLIPHVRIGKRIRFNLEALETWLECGGTPWAE